MQKEMRSIHERTEEQILDVDYSLATVQSLHGLATFKNINELMLSSIERLQRAKLGRAQMQPLADK